jgi:hypothetical protein
MWCELLVRLPFLFYDKSHSPTLRQPRSLPDLLHEHPSGDIFARLDSDSLLPRGSPGRGAAWVTKVEFGPLWRQGRDRRCPGWLGRIEGDDRWRGREDNRQACNMMNRILTGAESFVQGGL